MITINIAQIEMNCISNSRNQRNQLLCESDKYMIADYPISDYQKELIKAYRKALRDYFQSNEVVNWKFTLEQQNPPDLPSFPDLTDVPPIYYADITSNISQ